MVKPAKRQYTIRNIPEQLDRALRQRAKQAGKSFNQVALDALLAGAGESGSRYDDLDFMIGTLSKAEAKKVDAEIRAQRRVDPELWK